MNKKLILLLFLLTAGLPMPAQISSLEELSDNKAYTIYNPYFTTYAVYNAEANPDLVWAAGMTNPNGSVSKDSYALPVDLTDPSSSWMIVNFRGKWYVYNIGAEKFLAVGHTPNNPSTASAKMQAKPVAVEFAKNGEGFSLCSYPGNLHYLCAAPQLPYPVSIWNAADNGSTWVISENEDVAPDSAACFAKLEEAFPEQVALSIDTRHGYIWSSVEGGAMPNSTDKGRDFTFYATSQAGWHCPEGLLVRCGENEWKKEVLPWVDVTEITIAGEYITDSVFISGEWQRDDTNEAARVLVFSDEFDGTGEPSSEWWKRTERQGATWNRWCSDSPLVVYCADGALHCLAIPNPDTSTDPAEMLTGGIKTQGKFDFKWGRAEARIKTTQHIGNFPAFWMMPTDNSLGWPNNGEIDIWETIDTEDRAYGTVHTNWTYNLKKGGNSRYMEGLDYDYWHIFSVEWDPTSITWYVDGKKMWSYLKSTNQSELEDGQWPFDAPFYLILNQSVGSGAWAKPADTSFTYETQFDWVRVYQKQEDIDTGIHEIHHAGASAVSAASACYDLSGRLLPRAPKQGVFIQNGKLVMR